MAAVDNPDALPAGNFSSWLSGMQRALRGEAASDVACDDCTACCTSSQFVHIGPEETATLAHIPSELLFAAPRLPKGHLVLGYDQNGHCPMLVDHQCSIYEHRPVTCRTYDCRIFPAVGMEQEPADKPAIARQAQRWEFTFDTRADRDRYAATRAAATMLRDQPGRSSGGVVPSNPTQLAVLAIEIHADFLSADPKAVT
jgi:Fe-S-cluster containining protein